MSINDRLRTIILQPTSLCNLNCKYCYLSEEARLTPKKMSSEILEEIFSKVFTYKDLQNPLQMVWHAGEPLIAGLDFYKKANDLIQHYKPENFYLDQRIQTNGVLINEAWCDFIKLHNITIGVSLDGPKHIHDANRVTWRGKGSFELTMRGIRRLQEHGIPFHVLFVVSKYSLDHAKEIFHFFVENGIHQVGFNIEELTGANISSSLNEKEAVESRYRAFLSELIELWMENHSQLKIREFERLNAYIYKKSQDQNFVASSIEASGKGILSFNLNGDIVPFSPDLASGTPENPSQFVVSNIRDIESLEDIYRESKYIDFSESIKKGVAKCERECPYFDLCGGGHPTNKYFEHQSFETSETRFCQLYFQRMIDEMIDQLTGQRVHG